MTRWTVADVMAQSPCYDKARVRELWAGREALSVVDVLDLDIPVADRLWAAWRMVEGTPEGERARVAMLTRVITAYALPHPSTRSWAEAWLSGADQSSAAAWAASDARGAARAAECDAQVADLRAACEVQR